jgi:hypothetical protein
MKKSFKQYHQENPKIYEAFKRFAFQLIDRGYNKIGARQILEVIRWETMVTGNDQYKINNNYSGDYARLFEKDHPHCNGIFMKRLLKYQED